MDPAYLMRTIPQIKQIRLFTCLNEKERSTLLSMSSVRRFDEGDRIVHQDEVGESLFCVLGGSVDISVKDLQDKEVFISRLKRGEVFGEAAIFTSTRRTATVTAVSDTIVFVVGREKLFTFFRIHPVAGNKILMLILLSLLKKIRKSNDNLVLEKHSEIDFDYVDDLVQNFITKDDHDE